MVGTAGAIAASDRPPSERVILKFLKMHGMWHPGTIAGFDRDQAKILIAKGVAKYHGGALLEAVDNTPQPAADPSLIEIDPNWRNLHHLTRAKIARAIAGKIDVPDGKTPTEVADEIIAAEVARRALLTGGKPVESPEAGKTFEQAAKPPESAESASGAAAAMNSTENASGSTAEAKVEGKDNAET